MNNGTRILAGLISLGIAVNAKSEDTKLVCGAAAFALLFPEVMKKIVIDVSDQIEKQTIKIK